MKKLLSLLLALSICLLSVSAPAEGTPTEITDAAPAEAADAWDADADLPEGLTEEFITVCTLSTTLDSLISMPDLGVFMEGDDSILFFSFRTWMNTLVQSGIIEEPQYIVVGNMLCVLRANGGSVAFYRDTNEVFFTSLDLFNVTKYAVNGGDVVSFTPTRLDENGEVAVDEEGNPLVNLIRRASSDESYARDGSTVTFDLDDYHIPVYWTADGSDVYLPLAVLSSLFSCGSTLGMIYSNGTLFFTNGGIPWPVLTDSQGRTQEDLLYASGAGDRPQALTELTYNLLCLELDLNYGLKSEHGIYGTFDEYLTQTGLKYYMLETDGKLFYDSLAQLTTAYFADFHSGVKNAGPYAGKGYSSKPTSLPASTEIMIRNMKSLLDARAAAGLTVDEARAQYSQSCRVLEPYMEVDDTAYITFDAFYTMAAFMNFYSEDFAEQIEDYIDFDTIALVVYAHSRITREDSPIRKVVIDLSNNGGGMVNAAMFVASWFLGKCCFSISNPVTGGYFTTAYEADVNLDGRITADDTLDGRGLELYCLISGSSFSCGNLVPAMFKESDRVVLLGQTSGGGACVVQPSVTADGTAFQYSSSRHICTVKNGSYYSVDQGVTPDFTISKLSHMYDRQWLTDFIADLP